MSGRPRALAADAGSSSRGRWSCASAGLGLLVGIGAGLVRSRGFRRGVRRDVRSLLALVRPGQPTVITEAMVAGLPGPVARYLTYTGVIGKPIARTVELTQKGRMRPGSGQPWMALVARQVYSVDPPGFVWSGQIMAGPLPVARARDMYLAGRGEMLVTVASLLTVVDARGPEMDQGSMMRYLSEMMFFPTAFLGANIAFEQIDDLSARVTLTDHGHDVAGTMRFDAVGRLTTFEALRYQLVDGKNELTAWSTPVTSYGQFEGLRLPVRGTAVWKLADGDLTYIDVTVTELRSDEAEPRPARL